MTREEDFGNDEVTAIEIMPLYGHAQGAKFVCLSEKDQADSGAWE